ncbi:MAG: hypothetical protein FWC10_00140, partial [Lentimicrobiaceae bacterium]|nr:hypothetical protein [Lentimicrobiaceae bacterium]
LSSVMAKGILCFFYDICLEAEGGDEVIRGLYDETMRRLDDETIKLTSHQHHAPARRFVLCKNN